MSPEKSFDLPVYAEALAQASLITSPSHLPSSRYSGDSRVLQFLDVSAVDDVSVSVLSIVSGDTSSISADEDGTSSSSSSTQ